MSETTLTAVLRTEFGKGAARRARRAGTIPAVLYGHGTQPVHLALPAHDTFLAIKGRANPLVNVAFEGRTALALVKDVQRDPVKAVIEHLDLVLVREGQKVSVEVPIAVTGEPAPGTIATLDLQTLKVRADATKIPAQVEVPVDGLEDGTVLRVADVSLPSGTVVAEDTETVVLKVSTPAAETAEAAGEVGEVGEVEAPAAPLAGG